MKLRRGQSLVSAGKPLGLRILFIETRRKRTGLGLHKGNFRWKRGHKKKNLKKEN